MADVYDYITTTGVIVPDTADIQTEVQNEFVAAFGSDLNLAPNTPQGILITTETLARAAVADNNATLANQINPNEAGGIFLDALLALTGSQRTPATHSLVLCTLSGVEGTSIPAGAQISDSSGNLFQLITTTVLPMGGTINNVPFQSVLTGPIPGLAGDLVVIVSNILGWETVTNPADATLGAETQTDAFARLFRQNTLGAQGMGLAESIISALLLTGAASLTFQENVSDITQVINEISMISRSLYTCVDPGSATLTEIAQTLTDKKNGGCGYNLGLGINQSINITNQYSGQVIPVLFDTPSLVTINIIVTVHAFTSVQNIQQAVQNAILSYASGAIPNEPGFVVGASVSPFQLAGAINILVPGLFVQEIQIAVQSFTQQGTIANTMNTVTGLTYNAPVGGFVGINISMQVSGTYIPGGTTVSTRVGSTEITMSAAATGSATEILTFTNPSLSYQTTEIPIGVWQKAVTSAAFITVNQV